MKKLLIVVLFGMVAAGYLFSDEFTPAQKKVLPILDESIGKCNSECLKSRDKSTCNKGIDILEESLRLLLADAKTKEIDSSNSNVKKSAEIMSKFCPVQEKKFLKNFK